MSKVTKIRFNNEQIVSFLQDELSIPSNQRVGNTLIFTGFLRPHIHDYKGCVVFRRDENMYFVPLWNIMSVAEYE